MKYQKIILVIVALLSCGALGLWLNRDLLLKRASFTPFSFQTLVLDDLAGKPVEVKSADYALLVLTFWATWCSSCKEDLPILHEIANGRAGQRVGVFAISKDFPADGTEEQRAASLKNIKELLAELGISEGLPVLRDTGDRVSTSYDVYAVPETFLVTSAGVVVKKYVGAIAASKEAFLADVRRLAAQRE